MALPSLTKEQQRDITRILHRWIGKLTWCMLVERISKSLEINTTRQTLSTYPSIKNAYNEAKNRNRGNVKSVQALAELSCKEVDLAKQNLSLKAEVKALEKTVDIQLAFIQEIIKESSINPALLHVLKALQQKLG